jgi:hypothetical protein
MTTSQWIELIKYSYYCYIPFSMLMFLIAYTFCNNKTIFKLKHLLFPMYLVDIICLEISKYADDDNSEFCLTGDCEFNITKILFLIPVVNLILIIATPIILLICIMWVYLFKKFKLMKEVISSKQITRAVYRILNYQLFKSK